jgi:hypothetical protein
MRVILILLLIAGAIAAPSGQCKLSSDRCIEADFQPTSDARKCGPGTIEEDPSLKECNGLEVCTGPSDDEKAFYFCNLVTDAGDPDGPIEAACKQWKIDQYCESDTGAIIGIIIGAVVVLGAIAFLVWYFVINAKVQEEAVTPKPGEESLLKRSKRRRKTVFKDMA